MCAPAKQAYLVQTFGLEPADIDLVVHSHMHGDHVGWNVRPAEAGEARGWQFIRSWASSSVVACVGGP